MFVAAGLLFYRSEANRIRLKEYADLRTIAGLKADQISQWRHDRLADVSIAARSPFFGRAAARVSDQIATPGEWADVKERMRLEQVIDGYADVLLVAKGRVLYSLSQNAGGALDAADARAIGDAVLSRVAVLSDLYRASDGKIYIDVIAPIITREGRLAAMLVFRIGADVFLYPLMGAWPSTSKTAETLVVRRDGDRVLFLNELRHWHNSALIANCPLSRKENPAVQAVLGRQGMLVGKDYRDVEVTADLRPVPGSPWFIVAKVDSNEILAEARYRAASFSLVVFLLILLAALASAYAYRHRQAHLYRTLYRVERTERESWELFRTTLYSIGDAVITADMGGRVREMNPVAERLTGWREAEARGKAIRKVFHIVDEQTRAEVGDPVKRVLHEGTVTGMASHTKLLSRDGREYPIAHSGAPIKDEVGNSFGVVLVFRDRTAERESASALKESEERYRQAIESSNDGVAIAQDGRHLYVNRKFLDMFGYGPDEVSEMPATAIVHPDDRDRVAEFIRKGRMGEPTPHHYEFKGVRKDGSVIYVEASTSVMTYNGTPAGIGYFRDISGRRLAEGRRDLTSTILRTLNSPRDIKTLTRDILHLLKEYVGAEAAGVRMRSGDDFPYLEAIGFPEGFIEEESSLLASDNQSVACDEHGGLRLACLCGSVIEGGPDGPSPFFTERGSLWTNTASTLFSMARTDSASLRGRCVREGYESIALVPLRSGDEIIGMLQFADKRPGLFTGENIQHLEGIGTTIGIALLRKEAEERIRASEENYRDIFENAMEGMFRRTPEGVLLSVNPALARIHGYSSPEEMMLDVADTSKKLWVHPEERVRYYELLENEGAVRGFAGEQYRKDGGTYLASFNTRAVAGRDGKILYYDGIVQDITDKRMLEEQLRQAQKMEAIGTLAGGVAHDFNNLLTVIMGFSNLIQMKIGPDDHLRPYVDQIVASANKAADLTQSLLAFSRKQRINPEPHKMNDVVRSTAKLLKRLLPEDIELKVELCGADPVARLDLTQIDQVLMNLATNARDAMPKGGLILIKTGETTLDEAFRKAHGFGKPGKYVLLSVSDSGVGMDPQTMARIFEPFFTTKEVGKGTGLGLASVYGIVKQHEGFITVESDLRRGTTFDIFLPLLQHGSSQEDAPSDTIRKGTETLLIVEDDLDVRKMMTRILQSHGYATIEAADGYEAVRVYREHKGAIDLVLLDVVMPGKNGNEVFDEIAAINPRVKAIFVSGYTGDIVIDKGIQSEKVDFLEKPLSLARLQAKVREVLDR
jgi:PAS domain S-box-containing protein